MITWDIRQGAPSSYTATMTDVLVNGTVANESSTSFWLTTGSKTIIFDGVFGLQTSNTITGFHVYDGAQLLLDASGYSIARDEFIDGDSASGLAIILLLHTDPVTINGSFTASAFLNDSRGSSLSGPHSRCC